MLEELVEKALENFIEKNGVLPVNILLDNLQNNTSLFLGILEEFTFNFVSKILSGHPEFGSQHAIYLVSNTLVDYLNIQVFSKDGKPHVRVSLDDRYYEDIKKGFERWKDTINLFRKTILAQTIEKYAIRNSWYFKRLFEKKGYEVIDEKFDFLQSPYADFLYVIEQGNTFVDWSGVEYGGFSPVNYSGVPVGELVRDGVNSAFTKFFDAYLRKVLSLESVVTKTLNRILREAEGDLSKILESVIDTYVRTGKVEGNVVIKFQGVFYTVIRTKTGKLGLRYNLVLNRRKGAWE